MEKSQSENSPGAAPNWIDGNSSRHLAWRGGGGGGGGGQDEMYEAHFGIAHMSALVD